MEPTLENLQEKVLELEDKLQLLEEKVNELYPGGAAPFSVKQEQPVMPTRS